MSQYQLLTTLEPHVNISRSGNVPGSDTDSNDTYDPNDPNNFPFPDISATDNTNNPDAYVLALSLHSLQSSKTTTLTSPESSPCVTTTTTTLTPTMVP